MGGYPTARRPVNQVLCAAWRRRITRHRRGGLSVAEFSRQEGVSPASFYRWQQTLRSELARQPARSVPAKQEQLASAPREANRAARSDSTFVQLPVPTAVSHPWIDVALHDGTRIRLGQQNLAALQVALRACQRTPRAPGPGAASHV